MKRLLTGLFLKVLFWGAASEARVYICEVEKNGGSSVLDVVEVSLNEPLMKRMRTIQNEDGTTTSVVEDFMTESYISSFKIVRPIPSSCTTNLKDSSNRSYFSVWCSGVFAELSLDLLSRRGSYFESFGPQNTARAVLFRNCDPLN